MKKYNYIPHKDELIEEGFVVKSLSQIQNGGCTLIVPNGHPSGASTVLLNPERFVWYAENTTTIGRNFDYHNLHGPAVVTVLSSMYCVRHKRHRYEGPAWYEHGTFREIWSIWDHSVTGSEYKAWLKDSGMDIDNLTDEDKVLIDLRWSHDN